MLQDVTKPTNRDLINLPAATPEDNPDIYAELCTIDDNISSVYEAIDQLEDIVQEQVTIVDDDNGIGDYEFWGHREYQSIPIKYIHGSGFTTLGFRTEDQVEFPPVLSFYVHDAEFEEYYVEAEIEIISHTIESEKIVVKDHICTIYKHTIQLNWEVNEECRV